MNGPVQRHTTLMIESETEIQHDAYVFTGLSEMEKERKREREREREGQESTVESERSTV